jgi:hypothetical protein
MDGNELVMLDPADVTILTDDLVGGIRAYVVSGPVMEALRARTAEQIERAFLGEDFDEWRPAGWRNA